MYNNIGVFLLNKFKIIHAFLLLMIFFLSSCISVFFPDVYYGKKIKNEVKKDERIEKLVSLKYKPGISDKIFEVVIQLKDGRTIGGAVRGSIYDFFGLQVIDNYLISILRIDEILREGWKGDNKIHSQPGINGFLLEKLLNKKEDYFWNNLDNYINDYNEILHVIEKIYKEEQVPGYMVDVGDLSVWGNDEELKKYTGYVMYEDTVQIIRAKIYVYLDIKK